MGAHSYFHYILWSLAFSLGWFPGWVPLSIRPYEMVRNLISASQDLGK